MEEAEARRKLAGLQKQIFQKSNATPFEYRRLRLTPQQKYVFSFRESDHLWRKMLECYREYQFLECYYFMQRYLRLVAEDRLSLQTDSLFKDRGELALKRQKILISQKLKECEENLLEELLGRKKEKPKIILTNGEYVEKVLPHYSETPFSMNQIPLAQVVSTRFYPDVVSEAEEEEKSIPMPEEQLDPADYNLLKFIPVHDSLFKSIAQGLQKQKLTSLDEGLEGARMRSLAAKLLVVNREKYPEGDELSVQDIIEVAGDETFQDYVGKITATGLGGELEINLLSEKLERIICVYRVEKECYQQSSVYGEKKGKKNVPICLLYEDNCWSLIVRN